MHALSDRLGLSPTVLVLLALLLAIEVALAFYALWDLWHRDRVAGGHKALWVALILLGNLAGSILYLTVGRDVAPLAADESIRPSVDPGTHAERIRRGIDALYGIAE